MDPTVVARPEKWSAPAVTSIKDVARDVEMSTATVSRALRGLQGVSEETRERCWRRRAGSATCPPPSAAGLASGHTRTVAVIVPRVTQWFFAAVVQGAEEGPARARLRPAALQPRRRRQRPPPGLRDQPADQARRRRPGAEPEAEPRGAGPARRPRPPGHHRRGRHAGLGYGAHRRPRSRRGRDPAPDRSRAPADRLHRRRDRGRAGLHRTVGPARPATAAPWSTRGCRRWRSWSRRRVHGRRRPARWAGAARDGRRPDRDLRGLGRDGHRRAACRRRAGPAGAG